MSEPLFNVGDIIKLKYPWQEWVLDHGTLEDCFVISKVIGGKARYSCSCPFGKAEAEVVAGGRSNPAKRTQPVCCQ